MGQFMIIRFFTVIGFAYLIASCSPVAKIDVYVQSDREINFNVTTESPKNVCIDYLLIRDAGGAIRWELDRIGGDGVCVHQVSLPESPAGYAVRSRSEKFLPGSYKVEVKAGVFRGVSQFTVPE